jgi:tetratricopeptide (TPR) repeat protein
MSGFPRGGWRSGGLRRTIAALLAGGSLALTGVAPAGELDELRSQLGGIETEASALSAGVKAPPKGARATGSAAETLVDAQVAFAMGNYDQCALLLHAFVGESPTPGQFDVGLFFLAESLRRKGDRGAARTYFARIAQDYRSSRYHPKALERLVELASEGVGVDEVATWLAALDEIPAGPGRAAVFYVRGKYAAAQGNFDEALAQLALVPRGSAYALQALYFTGTVHIRRRDLDNAIAAFARLVKEQPRNSTDRRVVELAQLALARLYYEQDQPLKAIDRYVEIDRHSDLFDDALYEAAWVFVKGRQFDKALKVLEALELSEPETAKFSTVRILEGNLRVRKAQLLKGQEVQGLYGGIGSPRAEYDKASQIFSSIREIYDQPFVALDTAVKQKADPEPFLAQVGGRTSAAFREVATLPDIAAAWLRDDPSLQPVLAIEHDLAEIQTDLEDATAAVSSLETRMRSTSRVKMFPTLAHGREAATALHLRVRRVHLQAVDHGRRMLPTGDILSELNAALANRARIEAEIDRLPDEEQGFHRRALEIDAAYTQLEQQAAEILSAVEATDAGRANLQRYTAESGQDVGVVARAAVEQGNTELAPEISAIRTELEALARELEAGRAEATSSEGFLERSKTLSDELNAAMKLELEILTRAGLSGAFGTQLLELLRGTTSVDTELERIKGSIDRIVDGELVEVRTTLSQEKSELTTNRREFLALEAESRALAGVVLGEAMVTTRDRLYDGVIRADVGTVDVSWAQKEDIDQDLKRLGLSRTRELRQLRDEFRELLDEATLGTPEKPPAAAPAVPAETPAAAPETPASTPPSEGGGEP